MSTFRIAVLLAAFAISAVSMAPLRLVWGAAQPPDSIQVGSISGSIWSGRLSDARLGGASLGDLSVTASLLERPGDLVMTVRSQTGPLALASIPLSSRGERIENISASADIAQVIPGAPSGRFHLEDVAIRMRGHACVSADGNVTADAQPAHGVPALSGRIACRDGHIEAILQSTDEEHGLTLVVRPDGSGWKAQLTDAKPATRVWLAAYPLFRDT